MDIMKIVKLIEDGNIIVKVVVFIKFKFILFNFNFGYIMSFLNDNKIFFICVLFFSKFIVIIDGKLFNGIVKVFVYFMDLWNFDDIEVVYGSVSLIGEDGFEFLLVIFGMINYFFNDEMGNSLKINLLVIYSIDVLKFNIFVDE